MHDDLSNGGQTGNNKVLDVADIGGCWCGESYFQGPDGIGRVVSSGGNTVRVWKVNTSPVLDLVQEFATAHIENGQAPGVFTSVSSNGVSANSAVIWALGRPLDHNPGNLKLYAFDASSGATLFSGAAGTWPYPGDANLVPVVANGKVYVATNQTLAIFGLGTAAAVSALPTPKPPVDMRAKLATGEHEIYGTVRAINNAKLTVEKRDGSTITVDASRAKARFRMAEPSVGHALLARGTYDGEGVFIANTILHAKDNPAMWYPDR